MWSKLIAWIQSLGFVTQSAHFFAGISIVMIAGLWVPWYWALTLLFAWVVPKELFFDSEAWGEGHGKPDWVDATFYTLGGSLAAGLLYWHGIG